MITRREKKRCDFYTKSRSLRKRIKGPSKTKVLSLYFQHRNGAVFTTDVYTCTLALAVQCIVKIKIINLVCRCNQLTCRPNSIMPMMLKVYIFSLRFFFFNNYVDRVKIFNPTGIHAMRLVYGIVMSGLFFFYIIILHLPLFVFVPGCTRTFH